MRAVFQVQAPGGLIFGGGGAFNGGVFLRYRCGGRIFGGAYTWRDLFSELYVIFFVASEKIPGLGDFILCEWNRQYVRYTQQSKFRF